jgi:hypothetical protein
MRLTWNHSSFQVLLPHWHDILHSGSIHAPGMGGFLHEISNVLGPYNLVFELRSKVDGKEPRG